MTFNFVLRNFHTFLFIPYILQNHGGGDFQLEPLTNFNYRDNQSAKSEMGDSPMMDMVAACPFCIENLTKVNSQCVTPHYIYTFFTCKDSAFNTLLGTCISNSETHIVNENFMFYFWFSLTIKCIMGFSSLT